MAKLRGPKIYAGSKPVQFKYKPLGMENFAEPLALMQKKYDVTQEAIDNAKFDISAFRKKDKERAKEIEQEFETAKQDLLSNLSTTGNYREAAQKLRQLNKVYNQDPEITLLRQHKAQYAEDKAKMEEMLKKKDISQREMDEWDLRVLGQYQGLNYDRESGTYNPLDTTPRAANLESEIMKMATDLAHGAPYQSMEKYGDWKELVGVDAIEKIKTEFKTKGRQQITNEIAKLFMQSKRYSDWLEDEAKYKYYWDRTHGGEGKFDQKYLLNFEDRLLKDLAETDLMLSKETNPERKAALEKRKEAQQGNIESFYDNLKYHADEGSIDRYAEQLYRGTYVNDKLYGIAGGAADIEDYTQTSLSNTIRGNEDGSGGDKKTLEDVDDFIVDTKVTTGVRPGETDDSSPLRYAVRPSGGGGVALDSQLQDLYTEQEHAIYDVLSKVQNNKFGEQLQNKKYRGVYNWITNHQKDTPALKKNYNQLGTVHKYAQYFGVLKDSYKNISNKINTLSLKRDEVKNKWEQATGDDKKMYYDDLRQLTGDIKELSISRDAEFNTVENAIKNNFDVAPELKAEYQKNGLQGVLDFIADKNYKAMNDFKVFIENNPGLDFEDITSIGGEKKAQYDLLEANLKPYGYRTKKEMDTYYDETYGLMPTKIIVNDKSNKLTNDGFEVFMDQIKNYNISNSDDVINRVKSYHFSRGEIELDEDAPDYNIGAYNTDVPNFIGTANNGTQLLFEIPRKSVSDKTLLQYAKADNDAIKNTSDEAFIAWKKDWEKANPNILTLSIKGVSTNIANNSARNFQEKGEAALRQGETDAFTSMLESYTTVDLLANEKRKERYYRQAATMKRARERGSEKSSVISPPAYWHTDDKGMMHGYVIKYQYSQREDGIRAEITKLVVDPRTGEEISRTADPGSTTLTGNLAQQMRKLDIIYGVGEEEDLVIGKNNNVFVPIFTQEKVGR